MKEDLCITMHGKIDQGNCDQILIKSIHEVDTTTLASANFHYFPSCCGACISTQYWVKRRRRGYGRLLDWGVKKAAIYRKYRMIFAVLPVTDYATEFFKEMGWQIGEPWRNSNSGRMLMNMHFNLNNFRAKNLLPLEALSWMEEEDDDDFL